MMASNESRIKRKKQQANNDGSESQDLTKEETEVARFLRLSCPKKNGNLVGMKVDFFISSKLVDCLMLSKWGPGTLTPEQQTKKNTPIPPANSKQIILNSRVACVNFMQRLMNKQLFYRALKVYKEQPSGADAAKNKDGSEATPNVRKRKAIKESQTSSSTTQSELSPSQQQQQKDNQQKKKFKLEMHEEQKFLDANEPYVWVYDPPSTKTYIIGSLLILGTIGICLFPLWPSQVREGVYYLSVAGASFLGAILGLAALKYVLFGFVWLVTFGSINFWLFPNLTEDVGFFESFVPVYKLSFSSSKSNKETSNKTNEEVTNDEAANETESEETNNTNDKQSKETDSSQLDKVTDEETSSHETLSKDDQTSATITSTTTTTTSTSTTTATTTITKELSKSTLEISTTSKNSPLVKSTRKASKSTEDEGFELVDDDDLVKLKDEANVVVDDDIEN